MKTKDYYRNLKEALPYGALRDAAKKFNKTPSAISQIASGKIENFDILQYLITRAKNYQKFLKGIKEEMEGLK